MKKLLLTFLMIFVISFFAVVGFAEENTLSPNYDWYRDGTSETYEISTKEDLIGFANIVNGKAESIAKDTFEDKTVILTKDIDLTGVVWTPIGSSMYNHSPEDAQTKMFAGTFDGQYHTIKGLSSKDYLALAEDIGSGEHSYGLFGYGYGASIKNLNLTDVSISCSGEAGADGAGVSALIGFYVPKDGEKSVIENINVSGEIKATNNMGGVIGYVEIMGDEINIDITLKNVTNNAKVVTDARESGGIMGLFQDASGHKGTLKFINCINNGEIIANGGAASTVASGILGKEQSISSKAYEFKVIFEDCVNNGNITANGREGSGTETHAAGISTVFYTNGPPMEVRNCVNNGNITITSDSTDNFIHGLIAHPAIGETNAGKALLQDSSYSTGTITVPSERVIMIMFDINGGTGNEASIRTSANVNRTLPTGANISRDGYTFAGWNTQIDGKGTHYDAGATVKLTTTTVLYAEWRKVKPVWSVASIPKQIYTGKAIKPSVVVFDENNAIIDSSKYTVTYENDANCINVGNHKVKVTYNNETIEVDYEIIKGRVEATITPSTKEVTGSGKIELTVKGVGLTDLKVICDDKDVVIKANGNNKFTATIPNKDAVYLFTAVANGGNSHYETSVSVTGNSTKSEEVIVPDEEEKEEPKEEKNENPDTIDNVYKSIITMIVSAIGLSVILFLKKVGKSN